MPLLETFGAASSFGWIPRGWETNVQFFAIGGGGSARYDSLTLPDGSSDPMLVVPGNSPAGTYRGNSAGYPGKIASNTEYVPLLSTDTLRYPSTGTSANGSGSSIKIKAGETFSVVVGAGGIAESAGGDTKLIKNGTVLVKADGGACADAGTTTAGLVNETYCGPSPWYTNVSYTYMYSRGMISTRPLGSNASDGSYKVVKMDRDAANGGWGSPAANGFGVQNGTQWNLVNGAQTEYIENFHGVNGNGHGIMCPILPGDRTDFVAQSVGGTARALSLGRSYWDNQWYAPYIQWGYQTHWNYGAYGYYNAGWNWPYALSAGGASQGQSGGAFGCGGGLFGYGLGDNTGGGGTFYNISGGADGAFILAYPASLPPLSSTTGLAVSTDTTANGATNIFEVAGITSNPQIVTKNSVDYRVYVWSASGSFTV